MYTYIVNITISIIISVLWPGDVIVTSTLGACGLPLG